ncbi:hypothetical protein [Halococcus hamelinensis]|uniref:hypothetical protein n=1 Tax=Halococcus hamelinensis TaxID=332168 RepID=UPI0018732C48|nr:hypothetical protein [Halococcus hamelinensis]
MCNSYLYCQILGKLIHGHTHVGSKIQRFDVLKDASSGEDWDTVEDALNEMLDKFRFITEDSGGVFLSQRDYGEELVDYYEMQCGNDPAFFKERLDHVQNQVWLKRGLSPPHP